MDKRFNQSRSLFATDKVPESIFGIPIVSRREDYTEADLRFFSEHPEAGGYYSMGDEVEEEQGAVGGGDAIESAIALAVPFIKKHEKFEGNTYRIKLGKDKNGNDIYDKWTVGYGQTEIMGDDGKMRDVREGDVISEADASKFLVDRVRSNAEIIKRDRPWSANASPRALAALYDIAYNSGVAVLDDKEGHSPKLNSEATTARGLVDQIIWNHVPTYRTAQGIVLQGLVNRRADALRVFRDEPNNALPFKGANNVVRNEVPTRVNAKSTRKALIETPAPVAKLAANKPSPKKPSDDVAILVNGKRTVVKRGDLGNLGWVAKK